MPKIVPLPDAAYLHRLLKHDPVTGKLYWRERSVDTFAATAERSAEQLCRVWNGKNAGKEAFTYQRKDGYFSGSIDGQPYLAHRVIYKMIHGTEPRFIDHDDRNPSNNRGYNLVDGTQQRNMKNRKLSRNNTTGHHGIYFDKRRDHWEVHIHVNDSKKFVGSFKNKQQAIDAREAAEKQYGYHTKHGKI